MWSTLNCGRICGQKRFPGRDGDPHHPTPGSVFCVSCWLDCNSESREAQVPFARGDVCAVPARSCVNHILRDSEGCNSFYRLPDLLLAGNGWGTVTALRAVTAELGVTATVQNDF